MPCQGVYAASITPFDASGRIDAVSLARLLAWFEAGGCKGAVLGGTTGEGPSLGATEKRDLLKIASPLRGELELWLCISTSSLEEAHWLIKQASIYGADGVLLMPPYFYRQAPLEGTASWLKAILDSSSLPVLLYNHPAMTGIELESVILEDIREHPKLAGVKDSSENEANLVKYRQILPHHRLYVGDERLLLKALEAGWDGSISGAANTLPQWLSQIVQEWVSDKTHSAGAKHQMILPIVRALGMLPQLSAHKAVLKELKLIDHSNPRLPLLGVSQGQAMPVLKLMNERLGISEDALGIGQKS